MDFTQEIFEIKKVNSLMESSIFSVNQDSLEVPEVPEAFHNLHADKSKSSQKSLVHTVGFTGTTPRILLFLALSRIKIFQREKFIVQSWVWGDGVSS